MTTLGAGVLCGRRWRFLLAVLAVCGYVLGWWSEWQLPGHYLRSLPRENAGVEVELEIVSSPLLEGGLAKYDEERGSVIAEIRRLKWVGDSGDDFRRVHGDIVVRTTREQQGKLRSIPPGVILRGWGCIEKNAGNNSFYGNYLRSLGIERQLYLVEFRICGQSESLMARGRSLLRQIRLLTGERLVAGIDSRWNGQMLLALGLGLKEFIPSESAKRQVVAGTVHVFAISGMHVGMMALIIAFVLRWCGVPLQWQWMGAGLLSAAYVLLTGASPSGLRALFMAWAVCYARTSFRRPSWANTLGLAGCVAIIMEPRVVLNIGFIYSYTVVLTLVLVSERIKQVVAMFEERQRWIPRGLRSYRRGRAVQWLISGAYVSIAAWLASCGISLTMNNQLNLGAALINIPLGVCCSIALALCPIRLICGMVLPWVDGVWAALQEGIMSMMLLIAEAGAESALCRPVVQFNVIQSVLYHAALAMWLLACVPGSGDRNSGGVGDQITCAGSY